MHPSKKLPVLLLVSLLPFFFFTTCRAMDEAGGADAGRNTVLWISVDGMRPDYLDRAETPFLDRIRAQGAFSDHVVPVFPSITFSSHVSQATGVLPEVHGIIGNSFYDAATRRTYRYPGDLSLLQAEPIWITAPRQAIRTAVLDWPLGHNQSGPITSDYFGERYERGLEDEARLARVLDLWEQDAGEGPIQLIMGYVESPDKEGHSYGPDDPQVTRAVERLDAILQRTYQRALEIWEAKQPTAEDNFYLVISSDHGMSRVTTLVHPGNLTGLEGREEAIIITTGNFAQVHLDQIVDEAEREKVIRQTLNRLTEFDFVRAFRREEIPREWGLRHPTRTGDVILVLETGYTFSRQPRGIEQRADESGGPLGMHGYDPATNREMLTPLLVHRLREPLGGQRLGEASALQLHATICRILNIEPAPKAHPHPVEWERVPTAP